MTSRRNLGRAALVGLGLILLLLVPAMLGLITAEWIAHNWPLWAIAAIGVPLTLLFEWPGWPVRSKYRESGEPPGTGEVEG